MSKLDDSLIKKNLIKSDKLYMVISLWITVGLVIASTMVASLGAYFSIHGLGLLFTGAVVAVWAMGTALEFAKFMLAAYLHQTWKSMHVVMKTYLSFAIVVLSIITSIGIYGFLSDAYTSASGVLDEETSKLESLKSEQARYKSEIDRLTKMVEEIPDSRITKKLKARQEVEPQIQDLIQKVDKVSKELAKSDLKVLAVKKKVGPLIYIARNLDMNIDRVVSYLILVLVTVFDPLAICLVIAATNAIASRSPVNLARAKAEQASQEVLMRQQIRKAQEEAAKTTAEAAVYNTLPKPSVEAETTPAVVAQNQNQWSPQPEVAQSSAEFPAPSQTAVPSATNPTETTTLDPTLDLPEDVIVQMNFKDQDSDKKAV